MCMLSLDITRVDPILGTGSVGRSCTGPAVASVGVDGLLRRGQQSFDLLTADTSAVVLCPEVRGAKPHAPRGAPSRSDCSRGLVRQGSAGGAHACPSEGCSGAFPGTRCGPDAVLRPKEAVALSDCHPSRTGWGGWIPHRTLPQAGKRGPTAGRSHDAVLCPQELRQRPESRRVVGSAHKPRTMATANQELTRRPHG